MRNDSEILAAPALETCFETLVRVSQAIAAHRDPKELFGVLVNAARGIHPCRGPAQQSTSQHSDWTPF